MIKGKLSFRNNGKLISTPNTELYGGYDYFAKMVSTTIYINYAYIEFYNLTDPGDIATIPTPTFDRTATRSYYAGLTTPWDYLRIPIYIAGYDTTDGTKYTTNKVIFFATKGDGTGENGLAFDTAHNSAIMGGGLIYAPSATDKTQDIVIARSYLATGARFIKGASDCYLQWDLDFEV